MKYKSTAIVYKTFFFISLLFTSRWGGEAWCSPLPIATLGIDQGLSNNAVRSIFQDHNGFIWLGTYDGLNRYDGYGCKIYRHVQSDTTSLVHNIVSAITEDSQQRLWLATRRGVSRFDNLTQQFTTIGYKGGNGVLQPNINVVIKDIRAGNGNEVYIATEGLGLMVCATGARVAKMVPLQQGSHRLNSYGVQAIRIDNNNKVWVLVQRYGLGIYNPASGQVELVNPAFAAATSLETDNGYLWIGQANGIYQYNIAANTFGDVREQQHITVSGNFISSLLAARDGSLWIGTDDGHVAIWNRKTHVTDYLLPGDGKYALGGGAVYALYEDKDARKWIGTLLGGANIIDAQRSKFITLEHEPYNANSLQGKVITALYEPGDSCLWIGTESGGINIWNRRTNRVSHLMNEPGYNTSLRDHYITNIQGDYLHRIWIGTFSKGVSLYQNGRFQYYSCINPATGNNELVIGKLYEDKQQHLWASTLRQGSLYGALFCFNNSTNRFEVFDTGLSDLFVLKEDSEGRLWGGNLDQLVEIDRQKHQHQFYATGYTVRAIYEDGRERLWLGTDGGGLLLFNKKTRKIEARYTTIQGLCNDAVLNILDDHKGHLWLSTYHGLSCFNVTTGSFTNYYQEDGLQSNQFHFNAALQLKSGEMAFGGIKGVSVFNPAAMEAADAMPHLLLTATEVDNKPLEKEAGFISAIDGDRITAIEIPYHRAVLAFQFTALEYVSPNKINYSYFMDGWDKAWNNNGNNRTAVYTHLREGSYVFRVKCTNAKGDWNPQQITMRIVVLPPWYRTWWAYLLYGLLVLAAVYWVYLYKIRQNRLTYEVKVAHLNAQKEKEINEKKLTFFTHISHEFRTPLTLIINPLREMLADKAKPAEPEELNTVYRNARRLLSLVDQLLLFRKADSDADQFHLQPVNLAHLAKEVYLCFVNQARMKKIDYRFECSEEQLCVLADREKMEIILFNLLSNALKFTPQDGKITLQLQLTGSIVEVKVADTGCGIDAESSDKLFRKFYQVKGKNNAVKGGFGIGLYLVKHFSEGQGGVVTFNSETGKGTCFLLQFPALPESCSVSDKPENMSAEPETTLEADATNEELEGPAEVTQEELAELVTGTPVLLVIDDDAELRRYIARIFQPKYTVVEANNGKEGMRLAKHHLPDIIITDITMEYISGIELCALIKNDPDLSHIPVILLTATTDTAIKLESIKSGADDYITKPFEKELLQARVEAILEKRNVLQQYFYNEVTLKKNDIKVSVEYKAFLEKCISIVEAHLDNDNFTVKDLSQQIGISYSRLYKKVKSVSGQSIKGFIRFIRLRKAAEIMINTEHNVNEIATMVGFNDIKYFRRMFNALFGMNPSAYIKKFRKPFHNTHHLHKKVRKD